MYTVISFINCINYLLYFDFVSQKSQGDVKKKEEENVDIKTVVCTHAHADTVSHKQAPTYARGSTSVNAPTPLHTQCCCPARTCLQSKDVPTDAARTG